MHGHIAVSIVLPMLVMFTRAAAPQVDNTVFLPLVQYDLPDPTATQTPTVTATETATEAPAGPRNLAVLIPLNLNAAYRSSSANAASLASTKENEQRHLVRDLHDSLGQYLTALDLGLKSVQALSTTLYAASSWVTSAPVSSPNGN